MGKTRRMLGWARCPRPFCESLVWVNDDGEVEDDSACGHEDYTDAELALIYATTQPPDDDGSDYGYDNLGGGR